MPLAPRSLAVCSLLPLALGACGDDRAVTGSTTAATTAATTAPAPATGTGDQPTTGRPDDGATTTSSGATGGASDTASIKFDLHVPGEQPGLENCPGDGEPAFSYIWIANSVEGTVSKIITLKAANSGEYGGIQGVA